MMQSLVFGLCIITSAYYSLRKWDHLQMNRLFMGNKTICSAAQLQGNVYMQVTCKKLACFASSRKGTHVFSQVLARVLVIRGAARINNHIRAT